MIVLDSNLWVFGLLGQNDRAAGLLDDIEHGGTLSAINAYMVQEVLDAFEGPHSCHPLSATKHRPRFSPGCTG